MYRKKNGIATGSLTWNLEAYNVVVIILAVFVFTIAALVSTDAAIELAVVAGIFVIIRSSCC